MAAWSPETRAFFDRFYSEVYPDEYDGRLGLLAGQGAESASKTSHRVDLLRAAAAGYAEEQTRPGEPTADRLDRGALLALVDEMEPFLSVRDEPIRFTSQPRRAQISPLTLTTYPNPTVAGVSIRTASASPATVQVFDRMGREVFTTSIRPNETLDWSLRDRSGRRVSAGVYILRVTEGDRSVTRTLTVL